MKFVGNFTEAMKAVVVERMERLNKYFDSHETVVASFTKVRNEVKLEISIGNNIRASKVGENFYSLISDVVEKLDGQIRRYRTSKIFNKRHQSINEFAIEDRDKKTTQSVSKYSTSITKEKTVVLDRMDPEEAIEMMEVLGHSFFIFKNILNHDETCVVYKKFDGTYGLITTK